MWIPSGFLAITLILAQVLGSIEGRVVRTGTDVPIGRVKVTLTSRTPSSAGLTTITGDDGRFVFPNVPAGDYQVSASHDGYSASPYDVRRQLALLVSLADGETKNVAIRLTALGTISGELRDESGEPLVNVQVEAVNYRYRDATRELSIAATARTDDRGEFRIYWIPPGRYLVRAAHASVVNAQPGTTLVRAMGPTSNDTLSRVYFPGTTRAELATPIDVPPGLTFSGVNWTVGAIPSVHIRGRAINGLTGQPLHILTTAVTLKDKDGQTVGSVATATDGSFEFRSVVPSSYTLAASVVGSDETRGARVVGRMQLDVGDRDIDNVALILQPGYNILGRLLVNDGATPAGEDAFGNLRVELRTIPWDPQLSSNFPYGPTRPAADGTFSLPGVLPGAYRLAITGMPPNRYIKTATLGASEVLDSQVQFDPAVANDLRIVIGLSPATVEAIVKDATGMPAPSATVVFIPSGAHGARADMYRWVVTDGSGRAAISSLVPGEYQALAFVNLEPGAWFDPELLRLYGDRARRVQVGEGASETVELSLIQTN